MATSKKKPAEASPFKGVAVDAARAAWDKKGEDIALLNVRSISGLSDFLLLVTVTSPAHVEALENEVTDVLERWGLELHHRDGSESDLWRVLDFGGLLVHLMHAEARQFYALDKLYHDAPQQRWRPAARKSA